MPREVIGERALAHRASAHIGDSALLKGRDLEQHGDVARRDEIAALREQTVGDVEPTAWAGVAAAPFVAPVIDRDGKAHRRGLRRDAEIREQPGELRIVHLVVDDETRMVDIDRRGMAAGSVRRFVDDDLVPAFAQREGGAVAGNAGTDDGDTHEPHVSKKVTKRELDTSLTPA